MALKYHLISDVSVHRRWNDSAKSVWHIVVPWMNVWMESSFFHIPEQTCVSARPQQQTERPHSHQSDSACNGPPPRLTGPIWTCPAPGNKKTITHTPNPEGGVVFNVRLLSNDNNKLTFLTVLSGSRAMSGILASTMRENRFRIRLEYLRKWREEGQFLNGSTCGSVLQFKSFVSLQRWKQQLCRWCFWKGIHYVLEISAVFSSPCLSRHISQQSENWSWLSVSYIK